MFQLYPHCGALGIHCGQMRQYLSCFSCFDMRYHPHLRPIYIILRGSFSRKNTVEELSTDPKVTLDGTCLFIHLMGYIRLCGLHCKGQNKAISNQQILPSVCAMAHTYSLCNFATFFPLLIFITFHIVTPPIFSELPILIYKFLRV